MDSATHLVMGIALGGLAQLHPAIAQDPTVATAVLVGTVVGSQAPDFDALSRLRGNRSYMRHHRGISHALPLGFLWTVLITLFLRFSFPSVPLAPLLFWVGVAVYVHIFIDLFNSYGTQALRPWNKRWVAWDVLHIFDPFLFGMHVIAIGLWATGTLHGSSVFPALYTALPIYLIAKVWQHHRHCHRARTTISLHDRCVVLPTMHPFRWTLLVQHHDQTYTLSDWPRQKGFSSVVTYRSATTPLVMQSKTHPDVNAFLSFSRFPCASVEHFGEDTVIWWRDLRYVHRQQYPLVAVLRYNKHGEVLWSDVGWISRKRFEKQNESLFDVAPSS